MFDNTGLFQSTRILTNHNLLQIFEQRLFYPFLILEPQVTAPFSPFEHVFQVWSETSTSSESESEIEESPSPGQFNQQVLIFVFGLVGLILLILLVYLIRRYIQMENENEVHDIGESRKHRDVTLRRNEEHAAKKREEQRAKKREAVQVHKLKKSISRQSSFKSSQIYSVVRWVDCKTKF